MAEAAKRQATYADIEALPPNVVGEILLGSLVTHPRPSPRHAGALNSLSASLTPGNQWGRGGPGGWVFMSEPELRLGSDVLVPDLAGWRRERLPSLPETSWIGVPPDWVCEILSDSTERHDRNAKRSIYANAGVPHLWLLDPRVRLLEVFQLTAGHWLLAATFSNAQEVKAVPFEPTPFPLADLWPFDKPDET
jgi:Uma2 family endonuclease